MLSGGSTRAGQEQSLQLQMGKGKIRLRPRVGEKRVGEKRPDLCIIYLEIIPCGPSPLSCPVLAKFAFEASDLVFGGCVCLLWLPGGGGPVLGVE